jgi:hypothetical protein
MVFNRPLLRLDGAEPKCVHQIRSSLKGPEAAAIARDCFSDF